MNEGEEGLFRLIAAGDEEAFARLYDSYKDRLLFYGKRFLEEWQEVEDIVSEAFLKLWISRADMRSDAHLGNFLYRTVRHRAIDRQRTQERRNHLRAHIELPEVTDTHQYEAELVRIEMLHLLAKAVDSLPEKYQRIFKLSYHDECSPSEIARILQINPDTVRSQKRRAIEMIRKWLGEKTILSLIITVHLLPVLSIFKKIMNILAR